MEIITTSQKILSNTVLIPYSQNSISIYPNPVIGNYLQLQINNDGFAGKGQLLIKNISGEVLITRALHLQNGSQLQRVEAATLPAGFYLVELLNTKMEKVAVGKFIKTN